MRARLSRGSVSRLLSLAWAGALTPACGLIAPIPPDARVVPVESGADDALAPATDDAGPSADAEVGDASPSAEADAGDAGPSAEPDAGDAGPSAEADGGDAGPGPEADAGDAAASAETDGDAGPSADAAPPADASATGCTTDEQCSPADYCSRLNQGCAPRCDAEGTCVGPEIAASNNRIVTDGTHVCYAGDGPEAGQYTVFAWDGASATPRALASGQSALALQIADGYCYFHADGALQRALVTGGEPETLQQLDSAPTRSWLTLGHVWWTVVSGEELRVFRLSRSAGVPEQIVRGPAAELWEAGNSTQLFRRFNPSYAKCAIAVAPIDDPGNFTTIPMSFSKNCTGALWASEESIVFTQFEPVHHYPFRVDLNAPGKEVTISLSSVETLMYQVRGGWLYGQRVIDGSSVPGVNNTVSYLRVPISGGAEVASELLFMPTPGSAAFYVEPASFKDNVHRTFAVLDGPRLVYQHKRESRLLTHALPAEPAL